jgi:hypothetical protein
MKTLKMGKFILAFITLLVFLGSTNVFVGIADPTATPTPTPTPTWAPSWTPTPTPTTTPTWGPTPTPLIYTSSWISLKWTNYTGQTVNDLEIYFRGYIRVTEWKWEFRGMIYPFQNYEVTYDPIQDITKIRWYNGTLGAGQSVYICWWGREVEIFFQKLISLTVNGNVVATFPVFTYYYHYFESHFIITIRHTMINGGPVTIPIFQIGPANKIYLLPDLYWDNLNNISWYYSTGYIHLNPNGTWASPLLPSPGVGMVYRAKIYLDSDPSHVVECVGQYTTGAWAPNLPFQVGDVVSYYDNFYRCLQAHTSQVGLEPPYAPSLWEIINLGATPTPAPTPTPTPTMPTPTPTPTPTPSPTPGG